MFDLETFRTLNDELKYELYKDLIENVTYFKRIYENLTVSTGFKDHGFRVGGTLMSFEH